MIRLVRAHPTVSVIDLDAILRQVKGIIDKASLAVQAVFVFTLAAGIAVLFAAVQSTIDERRFESAILRALGVKRRTVLSGVLTEFAALGFASGLLASAGASVLASVIAVQAVRTGIRVQPDALGSGSCRWRAAGVPERLRCSARCHQRTADRRPSGRLSRKPAGIEPWPSERTRHFFMSPMTGSLPTMPAAGRGPWMPVTRVRSREPSRARWNRPYPANNWCASR